MSDEYTKELIDRAVEYCREKGRVNPEILRREFDLPLEPAKALCLSVRKILKEEKKEMPEQKEKNEIANYAGAHHLDQMCLKFPEEIGARGEIVHRLRDMKRSWTAVGALLNEIARSGNYKEWGYDDLETYCKQELHLGKATVRKLMISHKYLKSHHPKLLESGGDVPSYTSLELLDKMRNSPDSDPEKIEEIEAKVFDGEADPTEIRKHMRAELSNEDTMAAARKREMGDILRTARNLRRKLNHSTIIPEGLKDRMEQQLVELESLD